MHFSCSTKKMQTVSEVSVISEPNEPSLDKSEVAYFHTVEEYYDSMLVDINMKFTEGPESSADKPEWLKTITDEDTYLYSVGISGKATSEQSSRDEALLDAQIRLNDVLKIFTDGKTGLRMNGYTHVSTYTQKIKESNSGKIIYISAVLIRIPKSL